jgi:hypothetical protein
MKLSVLSLVILSSLVTAIPAPQGRPGRNRPSAAAATPAAATPAATSAAAAAVAVPAPAVSSQASVPAPAPAVSSKASAAVGGTTAGAGAGTAAGAGTVAGAGTTVGGAAPAATTGASSGSSGTASGGNSHKVTVSTLSNGTEWAAYLYPRSTTTAGAVPSNGSTMELRDQLSLGQVPLSTDPSLLQSCGWTATTVSLVGITFSIAAWLSSPSVQQTALMESIIPSSWA